MSKYKSPAKKMRNIKRLLNFLCSKIKRFNDPSKSLSICPHASVSIPPAATKASCLTVQKLQSFSRRPEPPFRQHMGFAKACQIDLPAPPKPPTPKLTHVILKSTCDTPECKHRHRPCHWTGMPKPWLDT